MNYSKLPGFTAEMSLSGGFNNTIEFGQTGVQPLLSIRNNSSKLGSYTESKAQIVPSARDPWGRCGALARCCGRGNDWCCDKVAQEC